MSSAGRDVKSRTYLQTVPGQALGADIIIAVDVGSPLSTPEELDDMLAEREKLNSDIQTILDQQTDTWGIKVANVEIKHVDLDESMIRAIAKQAEAERERRAKVIHAEGEAQAAEKLVKAAHILNEAPQSLQLRYLQTLTEIAGEKSSTIVFPMPIDLVSKVLDALKK